MASLTQWTWVWVNSGRWWWTGRPGMPWFMGSQRVRHDWATELNWTELSNFQSLLHIKKLLGNLLKNTNPHPMKMKVLLFLSRLTFCDPMDCSLPDSSVHRILQARILEWVAISFSRGFSQPRDQTQVSCGSYIGRHILYHWATWEARCNNK